MTKTTIVIVATIALALAAFVLFGARDEVQAPIVDEACPTGYERVGEGCMTLKDACEIGGDQYYFDEATQECRTR